MLRSLRSILGKSDPSPRIREILTEKHRVKRLLSTEENKKLLLSLETEQDSLQFVPEIITVTFDKNSHYEYVGQNGFFVNSQKYVRLLCSSGNARKNTAVFIDSRYEKELKKILNNDRRDIPLNPAKFNAYFSLASSSSIPVTTPYFVVIPDLEISRNEQVEYVEEQPQGDDLISLETKEITFNLWDGMGLVSPRMAELWSKDFGLDYVPSTFVIRGNFLKGMVCVFDFHKFSDECGIHYTTDAWGNSYNVRDADVVITTSQFKLWNAYGSLSEYIKACEKNNLRWSVSRYAPEHEKTHTNLNYQFLQVLDLSDSQIESLCSKTINYFSGILKDPVKSLLYLLGDRTDEYDPKIYSKINDPVAKAIALNPDLLSDPYVQNHLAHSLNKRIKESYIGGLLVDGFYTTMIGDPYALCEHLFGLPVKGLLARGEHYNRTWLDKNVKKVASMRAPLTWRSEINVLNLKDTLETREWYKYIRCGAIYNVHGVDDMLAGGSDKDGDLVCLTDQKEIIDVVTENIPVHYDTTKVAKTAIDETILYQYDLKGFNSKVGFLTNLSTTMYAMLPLFSLDSEEYRTIISRLKQCRKEQGAIIDSAKGLVIRPIPSYWSNWSKPSDEIPQETTDFYNRILVDKRPYFFRYLYSQYNREYLNYQHFYENYCTTNLGKSLAETLHDKEADIVEKYNRYVPLLDTDCTMNRICHYLENSLKEFTVRSYQATRLDKEMLKNPLIPIDNIKLEKLYDLYKVYKAQKRNFGTDDLCKTLEQYEKHIRQLAFSISSNIQELANLAIEICYEAHKTDTKSFAWNVFGEGIVANLENILSTVQIPFKDPQGNIEFLGNYYSLKDVALSNDDYNL